MAVDGKRKRRDPRPGHELQIPSTAIIIAALRESLGEPVLSVIAGGDLATVKAWERGVETPPMDTVQRLRTAFDIVELLLEVESPVVVDAWFAGLNPMLGDRPPAEVLVEDPASVLGAAREFYAYG